MDSTSRGDSGYFTVPVKGPSTAFAVLFALSAILFIVQNTRYKSWRLLWLLPCACLIFFAGFVCLEVNAFHPGSNNAPSQGLLYSAAPILSSCLNIILFYLASTQPYLAAPWPSIIWALTTLTICVSISLTAQGTASFFSTEASPGAARSGLALLKASLVLQIFFSLVFIGILILFHRRSSAAKAFNENRNRNARTVILVLYASASLILIRNIFRTVQIFCSPQSPAWTAEVYFWVFDAVPLLIATLVLNVWHPGKLLAVQWESAGAA